METSGEAAGAGLCEAVPNASVEQLLTALVVLENEGSHAPKTLPPPTAGASSALSSSTLSAPQYQTMGRYPAQQHMVEVAQPPAQGNGAHGDSALFYDFKLETGIDVPNSRATTKQKKRKNLTCACDFCRRRKIRCDGKLPCVHCSKRDLVCHYSPQRRRGYKSKSSRTSSTESPGREVSFYSSTVQSSLSLSSLKTVLLDMYLRHFHKFSFNLVSPSALTNPSNPSHELAQTAGLGLAARALRLTSDLEHRLGEQVRAQLNTTSLNSAKALAMAAAYYNGINGAESSRVSVEARRIGEALTDRIPTCVALRVELYQLTLLLLSCCEFERRTDITPWMTSLEQQMRRISLAGTPEFRTCDSSACVELSEFTSEEAPFGNVPLEMVLSLGIFKTRHLWVRATKELVAELPVTPVTQEDLFTSIRDIQAFERLWLSYSSLGFNRPLSDFCLYAHGTVLGFAANHFTEAAHYLYVSLMVLWLLNQPSLQRAPSWLTSYIRLLFHVAKNMRLYPFAAELVKLEYLLGLVTPVMAEHSRKHYRMLQELAAIGLPVPIPVLDDSTKFAPDKLVKSAGGPGVHIKNFSELNPDFVAVTVLEPTSCLITTWLDCPHDDLDAEVW